LVATVAVSPLLPPTIGSSVTAAASAAPARAAIPPSSHWLRRSPAVRERTRRSSAT
jgi:hypothetical protein